MTDRQIDAAMSSGGPFNLEAIGPSPIGALDMTIPCRTTRSGGTRTEHHASIAADWSVSTPHDIELERIAVAMGGYLSCVELVDRGVPALRDVVQLRSRRMLPPITRGAAGRWMLLTPVSGCECRPNGFGSAAEAAEHARDLTHVAKLHGVRPRSLQSLVRRVEEEYDTRFYDPPEDVWKAADAVREYGGIRQLWDSGVHPQVVARLHEALWPDGPAMPVWFYLGVVSRRPNLAWISQTLAAVPDEDVAVWLCWTDTELDRSHPEARAAWLQAGVPRRAISALADGSYTPADVATLASTTQRTVPIAALTLAAWHRAGCHPSPQEIAQIDELGADPWREPSVGAIDWLWERYGNSRKGPTRTELGLLLALAGTRAGVSLMLAKGIRDLCSAAEAMDADTADTSSISASSKTKRTSSP